MGTPDRVAHRVEAGVVFPGGVIHERLSIESETGNAVAEALDGGGGGGANGRPQLPGGRAGVWRQ